MFRFDLLLENEEVRRNRVVNPRVNFSLTSGNIIENFRLTRIQIEYVLENIGERLKYFSERNNPLSPLQQLLITLHWLGNGAQYHGIATMHGVHKSTVCRSIHRVTNAIIDVLMNDTIRWPDNTQNIALKFLNLGGFPQVAGCIDGTMINIDAPKLNEDNFVNRHGNHAINAMMVCGPDYSFYAVCANWPGCVHDSRVLRNSKLFQTFEAGFLPFPGAVILGDSAYPAKKWLIPPLRRNPNQSSEIRFNRAHKKTRRIIENSFGILKEKFPCLNHLRLEPIFAAKVALMCCILHNVAIKIRVNNDDDSINDSEIVEYGTDDDDGIEDDNRDAYQEENNTNENISFFQRFINFFDT